MADFLDSLITSWSCWWLLLDSDNGEVLNVALVILRLGSFDYSMRSFILNDSKKIPKY